MSNRPNPEPETLELIITKSVEQAAEKLSVTIATKLDDAHAWRWRQRARASGMTDAELLRLLLAKADKLFSAYDSRMSLAFFIDQFQVNTQQLTLFSLAGNSLKRSRR
jgi:hypothetical protein